MTPREEFEDLRHMQRALRFLELLYGDGHGIARARAFLLRRMAALAAAMCLALIVVPALAHDSWISRGGLRNAAGEWCCGEGDCALMDEGAVQAKPYGYVIYGHGTIGDGEGAIRTKLIDEIVPVSEGQPSPDGRYHRCQRPDGSRRCFFAPPPNT